MMTEYQKQLQAMKNDLNLQVEKMMKKIDSNTEDSSVSVDEFDITITTSRFNDYKLPLTAEIYDALIDMINYQLAESGDE